MEDEILTKIKNAIKYKAKKILIKVAVIVSAFILIASCVLAVINAAFHLVKRKVKVHDNNISQYAYIDGNDIKYDKDKIAEIEKNLKIQGVVLGKDFIKKCIEAEVKTMCPDLETGGVGLQGGIYFYKQTAQGGTYKLKYIPENQFNEKLKNKEDLSKNFTIDKDGIAKIVRADGVVEPINYKDMVSKYAMPFEFPLALELVSQNPRFVEAVLDLVEKSRIEITIAETRIETNDQTYVTYDRTGSLAEKNLKDVEEEKTKKEITYINQVIVTKADTWILNEETKINKSENRTEDEISVEDLEDLEKEESFEIDGEKVELAKYKHINRKRHHIMTTSETTWNKETPSVKEKSSDFVNLILHKDESKLIPEGAKISGKNRVCYKVPGMGYQCPLNNLVEGRELLFSLLGESEDTQNHEIIMRYLLYLLTGKDYGYKKLNFDEIFKSGKYSFTGDGNLIVNMNMEGALPRVTPEELDQIIDSFTGKRHSNLKSMKQGLLEIQEKGVNPIFAIAVSKQESGCGTNWNLIDANTYNMYSIKGKYKGNSANGWKKYSSFNEATIDFGNIITGGNYFGKGKYTIKDIGYTYNGKTAENWINKVSQFTKEMYGIIGKRVGNDNGNERQQKIVEVACSSAKYGIVPKKSYCQKWVRDVYSKAGESGQSKDSALDAAYYWGVSNNFNDIQLGATIYGISNQKYGHVGIYIGNGQIIHNVGSIKIDDINVWIEKYKGICWGWNGGVDLTGLYPCKAPGTFVKR